MGFPIKNLLDLRGNQQKKPRNDDEKFSPELEHVFFSTKIALLFENTFLSKFDQIQTSVFLNIIIYYLSSKAIINYSVYRYLLISFVQL